jgi:hypothetical protein
MTGFKMLNKEIKLKTQMKTYPQPQQLKVSLIPRCLPNLRLKGTFHNEGTTKQQRARNEEKESDRMTLCLFSCELESDFKIFSLSQPVAYPGILFRGRGSTNLCPVRGSAQFANE